MADDLTQVALSQTREQLLRSSGNRIVVIKRLEQSREERAVQNHDELEMRLRFEFPNEELGLLHSIYSSWARRLLFRASILRN